MNSIQLVTVLLGLIAKNAEQQADRLDVPLALYIAACKVNDVDKDTAVQSVADSWDDVSLIAATEGASEQQEMKH